MHDSLREGFLRPVLILALVLAVLAAFSSLVVAVRDIDESRSEIVTLSWWTSLDAIRAFAGEPPDRARYFPEDHEYLLTRPDHVQHYRSTDLD